MNATFHKTQHITNLIQYIETHPSDPLDAVSLSNIAHVSYAQLYRDFYSLTGHSVKEYVRKRQLSNALALIKTSDFTISDIAHQSGYSSHQALCRDIKQTLNLTPSQYKSQNIYYFYPPFTGKPLQAVTVSTETIPQTLCLQFYQTTPKNIESTALQTLLSAFPHYNGRIFGKNGKSQNNKFCYELHLTNADANALTNAAAFTTPNFINIHQAPAFTATFATSTVRNEEQTINSAWNYLYSEWLPNSMFENANQPYFEEYVLKNNKPQKLKLYLPIIKHATKTKITLIKNPQMRFVTAQAENENKDNAEKIASQTVIDYLTQNHPHITQTSRELYLSKQTDQVICGVKIDNEHLTETENVTCVTTTYENYLMLESSVIGDYDRYADMLIAFARNNGITIDEIGIFVVYDAKVSFDLLKIRMYCPVKIDTK